MTLLSAYLCLAMVCAAGTSVAVDAYRTGPPVAGLRGWMWILLAGALWPVVVVGLVHLGAVIAIARAQTARLSRQRISVSAGPRS